MKTIYRYIFGSLGRTGTLDTNDKKNHVASSQSNETQSDADSLSRTRLLGDVRNNVFIFCVSRIRRVRSRAIGKLARKVTALENGIRASLRDSESFVGEQAAGNTC